MLENADLAAVEATYGELDALRVRFSKAEPPCPGSALAVDDATFPRQRLSELARVALATAWDHFTLIRLALESRRTYVTATGSVLRGALVASAQALWLVGPVDPTVRRERALMLAEEWYYRRIQFQRGLDADLGPEDQVRSRAQVAAIEEDLRDVRALRTTTAWLNTTDMIREAAELRFGEPRLVRAALNEWRRLGGDAHAAGWQLMIQAVQWTDGPGADGLSTAQVTGNIRNIAEPYLAAWHIFGRALRRFDELAVG